VLSYLPMAHIAERHLSHYRRMVGGFTVTVISDHTQIPAVLADFRPEYLFSPPRLYAKFRAGLALQIDSEPEELRNDFVKMLSLGGRKLDAQEDDSVALSDGEGVCCTNR